MSDRLKTAYNVEVVPKLQEIFNYANKHDVPRVQKIVINRGLGQLAQNDQILQYSIEEIAKITGQRPIVTKARKAIAAFTASRGVAKYAMQLSA